MRGFDKSWLIHRSGGALAEAWTIETGPRGTKITVRLPLEQRPPGPTAAGDG